MKINLFSIPIYIDNIDCSKIKINSEDYKKIWFSETLSSHGENNFLENSSLNLILNKIWNLISKDFHGKFKINLTSIWQNKYIDSDYQESHCHPQSHFSFVIYKKIDTSKTVFESPIHSLIQGFYPAKILKKMNILEQHFRPACRQDQIIVFPSFLTHFVLKNSGSETISGNIILEVEDQI